MTILWDVGYHYSRSTKPHSMSYHIVILGDLPRDRPSEVNLALGKKYKLREIPVDLLYCVCVCVCVCVCM